MTPRQPIGDKPMTSSERIERSRWISKFEETAVRLLALIDKAPENLSRQPDIPAELVQKLIPYISCNTRVVKHQNPTSVRFLKLGNGNQVNNKKRAMKFVAHHINAEITDKGTLKTRDWGMCHFASYTHPKGAMISTPNSVDQDYGGKNWHQKDHVIMFREVGDGRCIMYVSKIEPLFSKRTIGHHGVKWEDIEELAIYTKEINTLDVINEYEQINV